MDTQDESASVDQAADEQVLKKLHEAIANTAYFLWEQDGRPEGDADKYWQRAEEQHLRQREYDLRLRKGAPGTSA